MTTAAEGILDVESPGAATARQAAIEAHLYSASEKYLRHFLASVAEYAWRETMIYPPYVDQMWANFVNDVMAEMTSEVAEYVRPEFERSDIPGDVYATATLILNAARENYATQSDLRAELERVLSPDSFAVEQITASMGDSLQTFGDYADRFNELYEIDENGYTAAGFWDSLQETGSVWIKRIRRTTRTSATGLSGWITVTAIRIQDYPRKRWVTRHDDNVRATHRAADGQTVPNDQPFLVGGVSLMYPGERDAEYGEIVNCRCVLVGVK